MENDQNKNKNRSIACMEKYNITKISIMSDLLYKFNVIPNKFYQIFL